MRVVTTCHKAGFDQYGQRFMDGLKFWPKHELRFYSEGFEANHSVNDIPKLVAFKEKYKHYKPISWRWDVVRFANKVYAMYDAAYDCEDLIVWCDADCAAYRDIPAGYIESLLPKDCFLAYFRRKGMHTETGFWLMDGKHPEKKAFLDTWLSWYETDAFKDLREWHDCEAFDATVRMFLRRDRFKVHSLSGEHEKDAHPMAKVELAKWIDHCKGQRKEAGFSPENKFREVQPV